MDPLRADRIHERQATVLIQLLAETREGVGNGHPLDSHLSRFYQNHPEYGSRDRRLFSGTLFSYFRWRGWIDPAASSPEGACVLAHLLDATELHPVIAKLGATAGFAAGQMRPMGTLGVIEKSAALGDLLNRALSPSQLVPAWAFELMGTAGRDRLIETLQLAPPTWLRSRPEDRETLLNAIRNQGSTPTVHPVVTSAIAVPRGINLRSLPHPIRDRTDVQDLASQVTGLVCAPQPGQQWWDVCCGSGGKTLHLAELGGPSLSLLATDIRPTILEGLERRMGKIGRRNIKTATWDGATQSPPEGEFDGILLDAPCSGTGTWHRNPDARWRITGERVQELAALQLHLLKSCATRLRPGGNLIYATCSVLPLENEQVVSAFLAAMPGFKLVHFTNPMDHSPCPGQLRIHPWEGPCNGMFIAKLSR